MSLLRKWKFSRMLKGADFVLAGQLLSKQFSNAVIPNELARLLDEYLADPGRRTAVQLLEFDARFTSVFELSKSFLTRSMLGASDDAPSDVER